MSASSPPLAAHSTGQWSPGARPSPVRPPRGRTSLEVHDTPQHVTATCLRHGCPRDRVWKITTRQCSMDSMLRAHHRNGKRHTPPRLSCAWVTVCQSASRPGTCPASTCKRPWMPKWRVMLARACRSPIFRVCLHHQVMPIVYTHQCKRREQVPRWTLIKVLKLSHWNSKPARHKCRIPTTPETRSMPTIPYITKLNT